MMTRMADMTPMCHFCLVPHGIDHMTRVRLVLSDSTLNGVQFMEGWGLEGESPTHIDMETVSGGKIVTLRKAWERMYTRQPLPVDTLVVAGLNDLKILIGRHKSVPDMRQMAEHVADDFIGELQKLVEIVGEHSRQYEVDDTIAVAKLLHAPALYWHVADGEAPTQDYVNYKDVVDRINLKIDEFNIQNGSGQAPSFLQRAGERGGKKRMYMFGAWREERKEDMLHLTDPHRFKMVRHIVKYFQRATPRAYVI